MKLYDVVRIKADGRMGFIVTIENHPLGRLARADNGVLVEFAHGKPSREWFADTDIEVVAEKPE